MTYDEEIKLLQDDNVLESISFFKWIAQRMDYPKNVKAGKYEIKKGMNLIAILRMLKNGKQTPVNLVITKFRTKEDFALYVGKRYECDSSSIMNFLENNDTLKEYGLDSNSVMTAIFPNTYTYFWNTTPSRILKNYIAIIKIIGRKKENSKQRNMDLHQQQHTLLHQLLKKKQMHKVIKEKLQVCTLIV